MGQALALSQSSLSILTDKQFSASAGGVTPPGIQKGNVMGKSVEAEAISESIKESQVDDETIQFFTEMDIDSKGRIKHTYPIYFERLQEQDIREEIRRTETGLENKYYSGAGIGEARERLKKAKDSLDKLLEIRPKFDKQKDSINRLTKELATVITPSMYRRKDVSKGLVDAHQEARKMVEPVITLTPWAQKVAITNGIRVKDGKVSRDDASRLWQMGREALGEERNIEILRRD